MSQKNGTNETAVLVLALAITLGLLGGVIWLLANSSGVRTSIVPQSSQQIPQSHKTFAQVPNIPSGLFSYGGSTTWAPISREVHPEIQKDWPNFQLRYTHPIFDKPGSGTGIKMLLNGELDFSQSSRPIKDEEYQKAQQRGFKLKEIPVAIDGIAIAVNHNLNIPGLTLAQLKDIYTGKVTNWEQVGGPILPILPYSRRLEDSGTIEFFHENVLKKENFGVNVQFIPTTTQALRKVGKNPGGIYYASASEIVEQCTIKPLPLGRQSQQLVSPYKEPFIPPQNCSPQHRNQVNVAAFQKSDDYPITRKLFVIVKQNGATEQQAGEAYANLLRTERGQELITKAGFVRIR